MLPTQLLMEPAKNKQTNKQKKKTKKKKRVLQPVKSLSYLESKSSDCHLNRKYGEECKVQITTLT